MAFFIDPLCCFSDKPIDDDPRKDFRNTFKVSMKEAPGTDSMGCLYGCCCQCCASYQLRVKALENDMTQYTCCQGYANFCSCCKAGSMGEQSCPECCLCLEVCCCPGCAMSATRHFVQDKYNIVNDPFDNKIIRFNNAVQLIRCICNILAMIDDSFDAIANIVDVIAEIVFAVVHGCMYAQINYELNPETGAPGSGGGQGKGAVGGDEGMDRK